MYCLPVQVVAHPGDHVDQPAQDDGAAAGPCGE